MKRHDAITTSSETRGAAKRAAPFVAGLILTASAAAVALAAPPRGGGAQGNPVPPPAPMPLRTRQRGAKLVEGPNPVRIIIRMVRFGMAQPYVAHEVTLNARGVETEQWVRWDPKMGMRIERIRPDAGDIMIDNFQQQFEYAAAGPNKTRQWARRGSFLKRENAGIKDVLRRIASGELRAEWAGQETIAGRVADIVHVFPASASAAPSIKFWVDRQTGVRLKMEELGPMGRTLSSAYLLTLDLNPTLDAGLFQPPAEAVVPPTKTNQTITKYRTLAEAAQAGITPRQPGYLPAGFTLSQVDVRGARNETITQRYRNGLSVLSLTQAPRLLMGKRYIDQLGKAPSGFLSFPNGARAYVWRDTPSHLYFALIGNLPDDQLKRIADSVR